MLTVEAAYTKNRVKAVQPLPQSIVTLLREYLRGLPDRPVWPVAKGLTNLMVQKDLGEAGIPVVVEGRSYDFHSLRGQFATKLALAGGGAGGGPEAAAALDAAAHVERVHALAAGGLGA